jgi:2-C-methyl-D-erythritol 4-phosphate cytidylyltransferase
MPQVVYAIVPAAGHSMRLYGGKASKLDYKLPNGATVLEQCLSSLVESGVCQGIVVACREQDIPEREKSLKKIIPESMEFVLVPGGEDRQSSVQNALLEVKDRADFIMVHDAARPGCSKELIQAVLKRGVESGAAILAEKSSATVKYSDPKEGDNPIVEKTIDRERVWLAQTPQVFSTELLINAYSKAESDGFKATDESSLVENYGEAVSLVPGSSSNIKITTKDDLQLVDQMFSTSPS